MPHWHDACVHRSGAKVGHRSGTKRRKLFSVLPSSFLALKVQLVVSVSAFVMVSTAWSVSCLLFFYSRCPLCPAICKSGDHVPPCPLKSALLERDDFIFNSFRNFKPVKRFHNRSDVLEFWSHGQQFEQEHSEIVLTPSKHLSKYSLAARASNLCGDTNVACQPSRSARRRRLHGQRPSPQPPLQQMTALL